MHVREADAGGGSTLSRSLSEKLRDEKGVLQFPRKKWSEVRARAADRTQREIFHRIYWTLYTSRTMRGGGRREGREKVSLLLYVFRYRSAGPTVTVIHAVQSFNVRRNSSEVMRSIKCCVHVLGARFLLDLGLFTQFFLIIPIIFTRAERRNSCSCFFYFRHDKSSDRYLQFQWLREMFLFLLSL